MSRPVILAWLVHLYTASGAVLAAWAILALFNNADQPDYRTAWILITVTIALDATDGALARAFRVKEVLPNFDGRRLDDIVDYISWVLVPVLLLVVADMLPAWAIFAPLLASGYGFAQEQAKTDDNYFLGWPSYWSILAFILFEFDAPQWIATPIVFFFSIMILVPIRYPYPSRMSALRTPTLLLTIPWVAIGLYQIYLLPERPLWLAILYCFYPVYYIGLTIYLAWQRRQQARTLPPLDAGRAV
jgi:phosphatidylcholine synthase